MAVVAVADNKKDQMFAFTCTSDYVNVAKMLQTSKTNLGSCVDSGVSDIYSLDRDTFTNYKLINWNITIADG